MLPALRTMDSFAARPTNRMESLFDRVFGEDAAARSQGWPGLPLALWEDEDRFHMEAELPGIAEQDVDITLHNGVVLIRAERKAEEGRRYTYNGRTYGRFEQVIKLPEGLNTEDVRARMADGVLHVSLAKIAEAKPRKIAINNQH